MYVSFVTLCLILFYSAFETGSEYIASHLNDMRVNAVKNSPS